MEAERCDEVSSIFTAKLSWDVVGSAGLANRANPAKELSTPEELRYRSK